MEGPYYLYRDSTAYGQSHIQFRYMVQWPHGTDAVTAIDPIIYQSVPVQDGSSLNLSLYALTRDKGDGGPADLDRSPGCSWFG